MDCYLQIDDDRGGLEVVERQAFLLTALGYDEAAYRTVENALVQTAGLQSVSDGASRSDLLESHEKDWNNRFPFHHLLFWIRAKQLVGMESAQPLGEAHRDPPNTDAKDCDKRKKLELQVHKSWTKLHSVLPGFGFLVLEVIPLSPSNAPGLFADGAPPEFWQLLQDMVFFNPKLRDFVEDLPPPDDEATTAP